MTIYDCMATGDKSGIIEVVQNANTVCDIHMKESQVMTPKSMHEWLYRLTMGGERYYMFYVCMCKSFYIVQVSILNGRSTFIIRILLNPIKQLSSAQRRKKRPKANRLSTHSTYI